MAYYGCPENPAYDHPGRVQSEACSTANRRCVVIEPVPGLLSREMPSPEAAGFMGGLADLLERCVNFGTHAFVWCDAATAKDAGLHHAPILLLYRHALEMA